MNDALRIAVVGSGPAALYAAAELAKQLNPIVKVNMIERLPSIGGLVRAGVAPDHADRRLIIDAYEKLARSGGRFEFFGNVEVGRDVTHNELLAHHHAVIYAIGASGSQPLTTPGAQLAGCHPSNEFVGWYNGHPDHADLDVDLSCERAVVIGNGNVALDIARLLLKRDEELKQTDIADHARDALAQSNISEVIILGRRGPVQASFTHPELHELGSMPNVAVHVDPKDLSTNEWPSNNFSMSVRRSYLERYATESKGDAQKTLQLKFLTAPVTIHGESRVEALTIVRNRLETDADGRLRAVATEKTEHLTTGLIVHAIGYNASPPPGLPFDVDSGTVPHEKGRILNDPDTAASSSYVTGWIKRGPRGVIGSNKVCAAETVQSVLADAKDGKLASPQRENRQFVELLRNRQPEMVDYRGWKSIDQFEKIHANNGAPRRKLCSIEDMVQVAKAAPR